MIKNPLGLLYVIGLCFFYALLATAAVVLALLFYGLLFFLVGVAVIGSFALLGKIIFVLWPIIILGVIAYKTRNWWMKKLGLNDEQ